MIVLEWNDLLDLLRKMKKVGLTPQLAITILYKTIISPEELIELLEVKDDSNIRS